MKNTIKFAYAVGHSNTFESKHFGDADKYIISEWNEEEIVFMYELTNQFKTFDEEQEHGSRKKGGAIIKFLKEHGVRVLVSKQFGENIRMVNTHFIPVIVSTDTIDGVQKILQKHIGWIEDEINNNAEEYKLFTMKNGLLKTIVKK